MFLYRFLSVLVPSLLFLAPARSAADEYVWKGAASPWSNLSNWALNGSAPAAAPGASASAYTHWMVTNGTDSAGMTNIGGLGSGGRYLKGIRVAGVNNQPGGKVQLFVLNTSSGVYLRVETGGITVENTSTGGYNADFGIAQLRVAADQEWNVAEGRCFYVGQDDGAPSGGLYSLTSENDAPRRVTVTGGGAVRIGEGMLLNNISGLIGFVMNAGKGMPTLDLADRGMSNTITVEDAGRLEGMSLYQGSLVTQEKASVTFSGTSAKASGQWNIGANTEFALENSTLDLAETGVDGNVTLSGSSGITGDKGTLKQTILDDARVTYTDRHVKAGEIRNVGRNVTITLNNSSIHFDGEIPAVDLVVQGSCTLGGSGTFPGTITYAPGGALSVEGDISLPSSSLTLGRVHVSVLDGVPQKSAVQPESPSLQAREYVVLFDSSFEDLIAAWPGRHTLGVQFKPETTASITVKELPKGAVSWNYDEAAKLLTLQTDVAEKPAMPGHVSGARPNIIFVLVDDMGWGDLEENWNHQDKNGRTVTRRNSFKTPQLNSMATEGMQLRRHYSAAPVCAPARASLLLGVHQGHSRVIRNNSFDYPIENSHTLATVLKGAGYHTAAVGKWGIGGYGQGPSGLYARPNERGFDYFYGIMEHLTGHYHYITESKNIYEYNDGASSPAFANVTNKVPDTAYDTDLFGARAKQWIVDHHAKSATQPFFLYLAFPAPHGSLAVPACAYPPKPGLKGGLQWVAGNEDGYEASNTATAQRAAAAGVEGTFSKDTYIHPDNEGINDASPNQTEKRHATMIRRVDDVMGDLIQTLKDLGIDDNTMIVFTSDNGPHNESGSDGQHQRGAQNPAFFQSYGMMDGIKRDCWEGGMRVPTLVRWPGVIPANGISLNACQFHDWMATCADAAGVAVPALCDGVSLLPTLAGVPERQKESLIYSEYNYGGNGASYQDFLSHHKSSPRGLQQVVFVDGLKGVRFNISGTDQDFQIYDTEKDPQEASNLASSRPDLQAKMKARALSVRRSLPSTNGTLNAGDVPAATAPANLRQGLKMRYWNRGFDWVPDFRQMEEAPSVTGAVSSLSVNAGSAAQKGVELTGYLTVPVTGEYKFYLQTDSNAGSKAFVHLHGMQLIDADYAYTPGTEANSNARQGSEVTPNAVQAVRLAAGVHPIRIGYVGHASGSALTMQWEGPGISKQEIPASAFSYEYVNPVNIDKTEETVGFAAASTTLTVQTQLPWTASCDQACVTIRPASGSGTATLDIQMEANAQQTERVAVVTVQCGGEERTFTLTQSAAPAPAGYDKWKKDNFGDGTPEDQMAPDACPAGDGVTNLMKYATGLDPNKPCGSVTGLAIREEGGKKYLVLSWPVNPEAADVAFSVESSSDLKEWSDEGIVTPAGVRGEFRDTAALEESAPARRFLRLKVTR